VHAPALRSRRRVARVAFYGRSWSCTRRASFVRVDRRAGVGSLRQRRHADRNDRQAERRGRGADRTRRGRASISRICFDRRAPPPRRRPVETLAPTHMLDTPKASARDRASTRERRGEDIEHQRRARRRRRAPSSHLRAGRRAISIVNREQRFNSHRPRLARRHLPRPPRSRLNDLVEVPNTTSGLELADEAR